MVMREKEGKWEEVVREAAVGLVSGAVWTDLDGDGYAELVLASEWGPLRVYGNEKGKLSEKTKEWGLEGEVGWWNGVTAGDVDGDGRMDVVATNWGRNSKYRVGEGKKRRVYYGDLAGSGGVEVMEAYEEGGKWVPERDLGVVGRVMPWVKEKYELNRKYAEAGVEEILNGRETKVLEVGVLESKVYLNRGGRLEGKALPREAQLSPGYGVSVGDFDGDGKEDVVMSQNFHGVTQQTSRNDGGRGLVLKGDGKGGFEAVEWSGVKVYGEGRGVAVGDYDGDGRLDVVMGQNGGETKLYRNLKGKVGVRVRLKGEGGNPEGLGAMVRVESGGKWGASREVRGGGGYWSQDSTVMVFGGELEASRVKVRWAGGKGTEGAVAPGAREIEVEQRSGNVRVIR